MEYNFLMFLRQNLTCPFMDRFMVFVSALGDAGFIWILIGLICLFFKKSRKCGIFILVALTLGYLIGNLGIKNIVARTRPYLQFNVPLIIPNPSEYSFPSGHTLSSFSSALSICFFNKKFGIMSLVLAVLIAFSRMYLFVHYPTDILAAIALSFFIVYLTKKLLKKA